ncbi:hypothetical protein yc1106_02474 [Curvularia clavata]|uniref:Alpha-ketoglutarate-dependent dioxygenase AlkB-like domain-containing protein n=1 Tax=Curvularia clavata TaxID=95742 RepID=A0A9Q8Z4V3_CURCL|nr:hypothetical protein yc1106_02474 [Curvularia clavata]
MVLPHCGFDNEYGGGHESATNQLTSTNEVGNTAMHYDLGNYGTLSSQRPERKRKRPQRLCDEMLVSSTKNQKRARRNPITRKPSKNTKRTYQTSAQSQNETITSEIAGYSDYSSEPQENKSKIVILQLPLNSRLLETSQRSSTDQHMDGECSNALSSPLSSLHPSSISADAALAPNEYSQNAQILSPPVPASTQDTMLTSTSQENASNQICDDRPCNGSSVLSPERRISLSTLLKHRQGHSAYPTPTSTCYHNSIDIKELNKEHEGYKEHGSESEKSYQTQSTVLLCPEESQFGYDRRKIDENSQVSIVETVPTQPNTRSDHVESCLESQNAADRVKPFEKDSLAPTRSNYADSEATIECEDTLNVSVSDSSQLPEYQQLHTIAQQLLDHRNLGPNKPVPVGRPDVWAEGRQELCETLHYYRSYQGACYATGGFVRGFMFDKIAHDRDYVDGNVIISRAGGGLIKDRDSGEMRAGRDQVEDSAALGLRNCILHRNPVVIIVGIDNPHIPSKLPHQYCVLDYFKPTHIWVEKSGTSKIVRYRFEKLITKKQSWWQAEDGPEAVELGSLPKPVERLCGDCGARSLQVYLNGWMCLQPACRSFWKMIISAPGLRHRTSLQEPKEASLMYDPRFLKQKTLWENDDQEHPLVSNVAELSKPSLPGEDTAVAFWSGMVCPKCGRCISRLHWTHWECPNLTCDYQRRPPHALISALSLRDPLWPVTDSYTLSRDTHSSSIGFSVKFAHGYRINRYTLPGIAGFIFHMIANKTVLEEPGGPDAMFEELQQTDIGLQRRPLPNGQLKGPNYCRQFLVNYGMPYKFIAATQSHSFEEAARPITSTRSRLNWAARYLLTHEADLSLQTTNQEWKSREFNEVLALGYFEDQKISYHDDGEFGLGPTIATLSLGAQGTMRIRMKARHYHGISSSGGPYDDAPPIPGCEHYPARLALQPALDTLKSSDSKAYHARRRKIPKELGLNSRGQAKDALVMQLGHGDIVVMHGVDIQKYYEHSVEHSGRLRFALTCRYIDPESLGPEDRPTYEVGPDVEGYDGSRIA